ncbi:MAG TPA: hypothetical protein VD969_20125 [Symbiobacteriaceae bacterium]|nr:hypothetical protein [Symbiobacteriaceae bacterium]
MIRYAIQVEGHLPAAWSGWFEGLTCTCLADGRTTLIAGKLTDQAALHGVLTRIRDLNLILISVQRLPPTEEEGEE